MRRLHSDTSAVNAAYIEARMKQFKLVDMREQYQELMENMVHSLISDRLLELSKYVLLDPIGKRILIDKSSMQTDGYQVLIN